MSIGSTSKNYPTNIDTFATWQDKIDLIKAKIVNDVQDQIITIENTLGINPQGSATDLVARLSVSLNNDGTLKESAQGNTGVQGIQGNTGVQGVQGVTGVQVEQGNFVYLSDYDTLADAVVAIGSNVVSLIINKSISLLISGVPEA